MSATIGDYTEAKRFTGNENFTKVLLDKTSKEIEVAFRYFETDTEELPLSLLKNLYLETKDNKVLLFPNSRGRAEEVAVKLKKISEKAGGHHNYFSHHSSVDKEVREYVEYFATNNERQNFLISCTSTLELGIDIGSVDEVVQIDATHSISSLIQRVGRSGRKEGEKSYLFLYATNKWSLLQSLACYTLYLEGFIEPPVVNNRAYDIIVHQALSIAKGASGISISDLQQQLHENFAFSGINTPEIVEIVDHLIDLDLLEKIQQEVIVGVEGEKIVNHRDFYSVFKTEENFKVINQGISIGEVPFSLQIMEGENILLAARMWKITLVDEKTKKIEVVKANDGKKPLFFGSGVIVHPSIRQRMLELLYKTDQFDFLEESAGDALNMIRDEFKPYRIENPSTERPLFIGEKHMEFYSFSGTRINKTIQFLFTISGIKSLVDDQSSMFDIDATYEDFQACWPKVAQPLDDIDFHLENLLVSNPSLLDFSKWGWCLPIKYKLLLVKDRYFDIPGTVKFLEELKIVANR
jgi:ATP-dependent Lhr-like helicase